MGRNRDGRPFARAGTRVLLAVALLAGTVNVVATSRPGAADCPVLVSGHWTGVWASSGVAGSGTIEADLVFDDGSLTGTVAITGSVYPGGSVIGSYSCGTITIGTLDSIATFSGTIDPDGRSASGTYAAGSDSGEWSNSVVTSAGAGMITTIAGRGFAEDSGDGGPATNADFVAVGSSEVDNSGHVLIVDPNASRVRVVARHSGTFYGQSMVEGHAYTIAGVGDPGFAGDGGLATAAGLSFPQDVAVDPVNGNVVIADTGNQRIRLMPSATGTFYGQSMTAGNIYTIAGTGSPGFSGDGGPATSAQLKEPESVAVDHASNVVIADSQNHRIRVVDPTGAIDTVAGTGTDGHSGDGGPASSAQLSTVRSVAVDDHGNIIIADTYNGAIRIVAADAEARFGISITAGGIDEIQSVGSTVQGLGVDAGGNVIVAETDDHRVSVLAATTGTHHGISMGAGDFATLAGGNGNGFSGDGGPASSAQLSYPIDVAADADDNLFIADYGNGRVREVGTTSATEDGDVEVSQTVHPATIGSGAPASWVLSVTNPTASPVSGVVGLLNAGVARTGGASVFETSTGGFCDVQVHIATCEIGTIAPGATETASGAVVATGISAPSSFEVSAGAYFDANPNTLVDADTVTVSVVGAAQLPPGTVSGIATPGQKFQTIKKAPTAALPIRVQLKLPKKVAAGTTTAMALGNGTVQLASARPSTLFQAALVAGPAVPMTLSTTADEASTFCDGPCTGDIINIAPFSHYNDRKRPAKVTITWDATKRGAGVNSRIFKRGDSPRSPRTILPSCVKAKKIGYTNLPCVFKKKQLKSGDVQFQLLLLSGDPKFARR